MKHVDLFSGIGGFALAARWNGIETVQFVEIDERCRTFLLKAWPGVAIHEDVRTLVKLCEEFVHIVGSERFLRVTPDVNHAIQHMSTNGEKIISKSEDGKTVNTIGEENKRLSTTMGESAPVVGSIKWSSFALIIRSIMAMRSENDTTLLLSGKSPSKEDSPTITKCFATTATMQERCTEYVRIKTPFLLTGGVPCQPASRAGKQRGRNDDRWLWEEVIAMLRYANPNWAVFENPPGIGDVGLSGILSDVETQGYEVRVFGIPACAVGAPHIRERYFIVGKSKQDGRKQGGIASTTTGYRDTVESDVSGLLADSPRRQDDLGRDEYMADAEAAARIMLQDGEEFEPSTPDGRCYADQWRNYVWMPCADGKVRRAPDDSFGLVDGLHRSLLGALGNSIVPQVAAKIIKAIVEAEKK